MRSLLLALGRLWLRSLRVRWADGAPPAGTGTPGPAVILLWHEHLPACIRIFSHRGIEVLISRSIDGDWAARACEGFGYRVHRGSSSKGGAGGLRALARGMEAGPGLAGMALDGPRGPRREPKQGSIWLSRRSGAPVVPVWVDAPRSFRLKSWDRSVIPLPFSEVIVHVGEAFHPESVEAISDAMEALERRAGNV
ncbi:MAG: hypothetical protein JWP91_1568 [Fibrobacteres bacterium]|nr:hypothetical protein [Fibrobacterota bacterium]